MLFYITWRLDDYIRLIKGVSEASKNSWKKLKGCERQACTAWGLDGVGKILKCRCSVVLLDQLFIKNVWQFMHIFSWLFPLQCLKFPQMNYMCHKNLLKIGIPQPFPCPAKSKLPLNLLLWMSCCLAVANLMASLMAENYVYMWVVPTSTTYSSYLTRLFSVFFHSVC